MKKSACTCAALLLLACGAAHAQKFHEPGALVCTQCHSVHFSEGGSIPVNSGGGAPHARLLRYEVTDLCLSCHDTTGANATYLFAGSTPPKVKGVVVNELPGGNFSYSAASPGKGHSPVGSAFSESLLEAPGGHQNRAGETCIMCHDPHGDPYWSFPYRNLRRIGVAACRSCHAMPSLSPDSNTIASTDADEAVLTNPGPAADQNRAINDTNHNVYRGGPSGFSGWCAACHPGFHGGTKATGNVGNGTDWIRHPTDTALPDATYGGTSGYAFPIQTTLAGASPGAEWTIVPAESKVFCLSCHVAHASAYDDAVRWDVKAPPADGAGCLKCHGL